VIPDDEQACNECLLTNQRLHVKNSAMVRCGCAHCAAQFIACFDSKARKDGGDLDRDNDCRQIVECGWAEKCSGSDCFCGVGVDRVTCLQQANAGNAKGPCADLILDKSHCRGSPLGEGECVLNAQNNHNTAISRASDVALCGTGDPLSYVEGITAHCSPDLYGLE
jgi:hypothetical protein